MPIPLRSPALCVTLTVLTLLAWQKQDHEAADEPAPAGQTAAPDNPFLRMDWLAGSWSCALAGGVYEAHYSTPAGGRILSHSRLLRDEQVRFYEFEVFEMQGQVAHLSPFPRGQAVTGFELVELDNERREAVFENPDKDYPTRISYRRVDEDRLLITLSDPHGGSDKVEQVDLRR